ncbi:MAG: hypothetical protein GF418_09505 [Chitinivibrionales bacterium]|nr:hypothetical protein [Chitinivibrionales bacterium]MBD3395845.1 hypothetical protein [Chitinivibrionales bacterium]
MNHHVCIRIALALWCMSAARAGAADSAGAVRDPQPFTFLPELHTAADISRFFFPKSNYFRDVYFLESEMLVEPVWVTYRDVAHCITAFEINPNMGEKTEWNVLFNPHAINFAITTIFEFRLKPLIVQVGEDHRCFHEIDRKEFPTVYWNMLYLAAGSHNMRAGDFGARAVSAGEWSLATRLSWYARWGVFLKGFFGIVEDSNVDFENNRVHEARFRARFGLARWRQGLLAVVGRSRVGLWREPEKEGGDASAYWEQQFGFEASVHKSVRGLAFFVNYILDDIPLYRGQPRFSKDRLLEVGFRVYQ